MECQAENRGATIEVFVNKENDEKISKGLPTVWGKIDEAWGYLS